MNKKIHTFVSMKYIEEHIEKLICMHGFLTIPGLGGLVTQIKSSYYTQTIDGYKLFPPSCEVSFNLSIQYNDGLLLESYMQAYSLQAFDAETRLKADIAQLLKRLNRGESITIGTMGVFQKDAAGIVLFKSTATSLLNSKYYGLETISVPYSAIETNKSTKTTESNDYISISISKRKLYRFTSAVASIILLFGLLLPISIEKNHVKEASLSSITTNTKIAPIASETYTIQEPATTTEKIVVTKTKKTIGSEKRYYIIVAAGIQKHEAAKRASDLADNGFIDSGVVSRDDKERVYIDHFDNREDAEASLIDYRTNKGFSSAWLLITK